jgi:hypothetical protein
MIELTASDEVIKFFNQANELAEVRDPSGNVMGYFAPAKLGNAEEYAKVAALYDPQEIQRRKLEPGGYTTIEVFEYLKTLTEDPEERLDLDKHIRELHEDR